jgi:hypothetical protein
MPINESLESIAQAVSVKRERKERAAAKQHKEHAILEEYGKKMRLAQLEEYGKKMRLEEETAR